MKKHKLIKTLLFAPLATVPLVAASCGSSDGDKKNSATLQEAAANALAIKFKDASKFLQPPQPGNQLNSNSLKDDDIAFSTDPTDRTKAPTKAFFLDKIKSSKYEYQKSGDKATYTYDAAGLPYLYIFAHPEIQDPSSSAAKGDMKEIDLLVSEFNENFTVTVNHSAKATDNTGTVAFTGYKKDDEVKEFKMSTQNSHIYVAVMIFAILDKLDKNEMSLADYKNAINTITSTSTKFTAFTNFEAASAATLAYSKSDDEITYASIKDGAVFKDDDHPIKAGDTYTFKGLQYNLNLKTGLFSIVALPSLNIG